MTKSFNKTKLEVILDKSFYNMRENLKGYCYVDANEFMSYKMRLIIEGVEVVSLSRNKSSSNYSFYH